MHRQLLTGLVALSFFVASAESGEWDDLINEGIAAYKSIKEPRQVAFPEMAARLETLFRSHRLNHVQIFTEKGGKRSLSTEIYYGDGELHVVQHVKGWNLVTKGSEAYEWEFGKRTGEITMAAPKELVAYTIYLTDPAFFPTYLHHLYLTKPELFDDAKAGESGCKELRLKKPHKFLHAIHIDEEHLWYGAIEYENREAGERTKVIFSKPKAIDQIPDKVLDRVKGIKFRKSTNSLSRHRTYL